MTIWVVLLAIGLGTYLLRATMFLVHEGRGMSAGLDEVLSMVAPAAMAARAAVMRDARAPSETKRSFQIASRSSVRGTRRSRCSTR